MEALSTLAIVAIVLGIGFVITIVMIWVHCYRTVEQGHALIITGRASSTVTFTGGTVIPILNRAEVMDISVKTIEVDRRASNGLICKDNIRADIKVTFFLRVNKTEEDVLKVASGVGVARASDPKTLEDLFQAKFSEALKTVGKRMDFVDLYNQRDQFKDEIVKVIGRDLNGYALEDAAIDYIEQTPLNILDPNNILDSEGRKKIIELTSIQAMKANEIEREAQKTIKKQDVEAREAILALERQQCEAEARQQREIGTVRAREGAEQAKVEAEEKKRSEEARITMEQELGIQRQNAQREIEIAQKNREGAVMVENERINKERELESIARQRATELAHIEQEKVVAQERRNIAEVIRERTIVEKGVAEEEEKIKTVRMVAEADRQKQAAVISAEQLAEQSRIAEVKRAEAAATASTHLAKEKITLAEAELAAAEKQTLAAIRRAEGVQAQDAAPGLAAAKVKEVDAAANEKQGMARVRVLQAEAEAQKAQGMAKVDVEKAHAVVVEQVGRAEAIAIEQKMEAEASGLAQKADAMAKLSDQTKQHEEFRLKLQGEIDVAKARVAADVQVAQQNSAVMAEAMKHAKFDIVGGDGAFFDRFVRAVSAGKGIDAAVDRSDVLKKLAAEYLDGNRSLPDDLKEVLKGLSSGDSANLAAAAALLKTRSAN